MLREITVSRQNKVTRHRRWFSDTDMDLFVWLNKQIPAKFQLSYRKNSTEYAITWDQEHSFSHDRVDDGENRNTKYKMSPILLDDIGTAEFSINRLARSFLAASENIDPALADFIYARLLEHSRFRQDRSDQDGLSSNL